MSPNVSALVDRMAETTEALLCTLSKHEALRLLARSGWRLDPTAWQDVPRQGDPVKLLTAGVLWAVEEARQANTRGGGGPDPVRKAVVNSVQSIGKASIAALLAKRSINM